MAIDRYRLGFWSEVPQTLIAFISKKLPHGGRESFYEVSPYYLRVHNIWAAIICSNPCLVPYVNTVHLHWLKRVVHTGRGPVPTHLWSDASQLRAQGSFSLISAHHLIELQQRGVRNSSLVKCRHFA